MTPLTRPYVWLSRLSHCRGFGIQSPTDYAFVRYVVNEHWPYYQYATLGKHDDWLRRKLGRLYFRLANWRQPQTVVASDYADYLAAGCRQTTLTQTLPPRVEMMLTDIHHAHQLGRLLQGRTDARTVVVVEALWQNPEAWRQLVSHDSVRVAYDLYYCGLLTFDPRREKKHYIINF